MKATNSGKTTYLVEASNGQMVRVPEEKMESWQQAQKERGSEPLSSSERQLRDSVLQMIYG